MAPILSLVCLGGGSGGGETGCNQGVSSRRFLWTIRIHEKSGEDPGGAGDIQLTTVTFFTLTALSLFPTGICSSASPSLMAWSPWPWWTPGMRCQTKPSKSATGLGTRGPWGCPMWKSVVNTRTAKVCWSLDSPATSQLTCVLTREAWVESLRDTHSSFLQLPFLILHACMTPLQGRGWTSRLL